MGKAIYEDVHGAAEFAEGIENSSFCLWHYIGRVEDSPISASHELGIYCPGFGPVYCRYLNNSVVRSSDERAASSYAVVAFWSS